MKAEDYKKNAFFVVGQFVHLDNDEENTWEGAYVREIFDEHIIVQSRTRTYKHTFGEEREDCKIDVPTRNGKRVMAKKNIFGRYTYRPHSR